MRKVLRELVPRVLTVLMMLGGSMAQTPAPPARDGVITGQVVDAVSGKPIAAATASISVAVVDHFDFRSAAPPRILTGSDGRFMFRGLAPGNFTIVATKAGYSEGASGRRVIGGASQPVVLKESPRTADVSVRMWNHAAIGGTIVDEAGEPVVGLQVRAVRRTFTAGRRRFVPSGPAVTTDDRGQRNRFGRARMESRESDLGSHR